MARRRGRHAPEPEEIEPVEAVEVDLPRPVPALLRLAWRAGKGGVTVLAGTSLLNAAAGVAGSLAVGSLLNALLRGEGLESTEAWVSIVVIAGILVVQRVLTPFLGPAVESLEHRLTLLVRERVMVPLMRPSTISHLEDPRIADELRNAQMVGSENFTAQQALESLNDLTTARLSALASAVLLGTWKWWAPLPLAAAWLLSRLWYRRQMASLVASMERSSGELRHAEYVGDLILGGTAAKETRVFGVSPWLVGRYQACWMAGMAEVWRQRRRGRAATVVCAWALFAAHFAVLSLLVNAALDNEFAFGSLFIYLQAALGMSGLGFQAENEYVLRMGAAPLPHVIALEQLIVAAEAKAPAPPAAGAARPRDMRRAPEDGIVLEDVSFTYPGTDRAVISGLDLDIPAGTSLAVVGENGAGKTTLVNLLCGFYRPTAGRILVDGWDLAGLDQQAWQRRIAAVFQDFGRYAVTLRENVTFGSPSLANDWEKRIKAAEQAGLGSILEGLPKSWYTILSREFNGGAELSGGQWQRVALARALFAVQAGAGVLVLDEPTANLDVRAEAEIYQRFLELTAGQTTILVSHRFSTVRRADRIIVLEGGRVAESGSHDGLMAQGGRYAHMFNLQAQYYQEGPKPGTGAAGSSVRTARAAR